MLKRKKICHTYLHMYIKNGYLFKKLTRYKYIEDNWGVHLVDMHDIHCQKFLNIKHRSKFLWLPWFPSKNHSPKHFSQECTYLLKGNEIICMKSTLKTKFGLQNSGLEKGLLKQHWWLSSVRFKYKPGYKSCDLL